MEGHTPVRMLKAVNLGNAKVHRKPERLYSCEKLEIFGLHIICVSVLADSNTTISPYLILPDHEPEIWVYKWLERNFFLPYRVCGIYPVATLDLAVPKNDVV